ncbi:MAG TPA: PEP-CTERM sorting domain-containing protein [Burkholderiales bacterium]|nr:PEP-CTERM sorting domain-containing protein [Burkholderiales bacterium]
MSIPVSIAVAGMFVMSQLRLVILALAALAVAVPCTSLAEPIIDVEKFVNGEDATAPPGVIVPWDGISAVTVTFTYLLANPGDEPLSALLLFDDNGTPDAGDDFSPIFQGGDLNGNGLLDLDETWVYAAARSISTGGQHQNTAFAFGSGIELEGTNDSDTVFFFLGTPETSVPEPSALLLLGLGLACLALSRRKRAH